MKERRGLSQPGPRCVPVRRQQTYEEFQPPHRVDRVQVMAYSLVKEMGLVTVVHERTILVPELTD